MNLEKKWFKKTKKMNLDQMKQKICDYIEKKDKNRQVEDIYQMKNGQLLWSINNERGERC